jgi:preprotein translocase subunit SecE
VTSFSYCTYDPLHTVFVCVIVTHGVFTKFVAVVDQLSTVAVSPLLLSLSPK